MKTLGTNFFDRTLFGDKRGVCLLKIWLENREKMNTYTISFPSTFCLWYAYSNCEKRRRLWGVSRMPIDQECKKCGKTFRNKGYLYCSEDCQLADGY